MSLKFPARGLVFYSSFARAPTCSPWKRGLGNRVPQLNGNAAHVKRSRLLQLMCGVNGSRLPGFCLQMSFFPSGIVGFQRSHPAIRASIFSPWAARAPNDKFGSRKENAVSPINRTFLKRPKNSPDARHSGEIQTRGLQKGQGFTQICVLFVVLLKPSLRACLQTAFGR